ncbi:MAG: hypothetical protein JO069_09745, partial [Verrucomicrobia bacterium]|nr:hypothetical protein [Verrucomicrobiota bacterium]
MARQGSGQPLELTSRDRPAQRSPRSRNDGRQILALVLILSLPSLYCFLVVPPLWRDSDGFLQVFTKPSYLTILQWPPLYCFTARVPLGLGNLLDPAFRAHFPPEQISFTDPGVYALLLVQHALLILACLAACRTFTPRRGWQCGFALAFALSPGLYAFAHCVGSESLSHTLLIGTVVAAARLKQWPDSNRRLTFVAALAASILTRHINAVTCLLLPVQACLEGIGKAFSRSSGPSTARGKGGPVLAAFAKPVAGSLILSVGAFLVAQGTMGLLCVRTHTVWVSRVGYTFQWRLDFLARLPDAERRAFLADLNRRLNDPLLADGLAAVETAFERQQPFEPERLFHAMYDVLGGQGMSSVGARRDLIDRKLNRLARTVLLSTDGRFWRVATADFLDSMKYTPPQVTAEPFNCTDWLKARLAEPMFEPLRSLATFRTAQDALRTWQRDAYFHVGTGLPVWTVGAMALVGSVLLALKRRGGAALSPWPALSFALALLITGTALLYANCTLTFRAARFVPPTYILFLLAAIASF